MDWIPGSGSSSSWPGLLDNWVKLRRRQIPSLGYGRWSWGNHSWPLSDYSSRRRGSRRLGDEVGLATGIGNRRLAGQLGSKGIFALGNLKRSEEFKGLSGR